MRLLFVIAAALCLPALAASAQERPPSDPAPVRTAPFPDVPRDHWAFDAVEDLRRRGILRGYPPAPRSTSTRPSAARRPERAPYRKTAKRR